MFKVPRAIQGHRDHKGQKACRDQLVRLGSRDRLVHKVSRVCRDRWARKVCRVHRGHPALMALEDRRG